VKRSYWPLWGAARHYFGQWNLALRKAGQPIPSPNRWAKAELLSYLAEVAQAEGKVTRAILEKRPKVAGQPTLSALITAFGSLTEAKRAAGVLSKPLWSKVNVVEEMRRLASQTPTWVRGIRQTKPGLQGAASRLFGSWKAALRAAGLKVFRGPSTRGPWKWTDEKIFETLRKAWKKGNVSVETVRGQIPGFYATVWWRFGSWSAALAAAKIPSPRKRKPRVIHQRPAGRR
jgi:hypothetical protein